MQRRRCGVVAAVAVLVLAACSSGSGKAAAPTTSVVAVTSTVTLTGGVAAPVATTTIPGVVPALVPPAAGTLPPQPTTTIPLANGPTATAPGPEAADTTPDPAATAAPAPAPAAPTAPPVTDITDGDPTRFCPAVEQVFPLYYVMSIGSLQGGNAAAYEVAVAPALARPLNEAATTAPSVVATPFRHWADRTALAVAAFKSAGATDVQIASFGQAYAAQVAQLTDAGGTQSPPDPLDAAARAGIDRNRLASAAAAFVQANGSFESFAASLGQDVSLTPDAQQKLEQLFPCAADLTNFTP